MKRRGTQRYRLTFTIAPVRRRRGDTHTLSSVIIAIMHECVSATLE